MTESYELRKRGVSVMFAKKGRRCTIQFDTPRPEVCLCLSKLDFLVNLVVSRSFQKVSFLAHSVASLKEFVSKTSKHYSGFTYEDGIFMAKTIGFQIFYLEKHGYTFSSLDMENVIVLNNRNFLYIGVCDLVKLENSGMFSLFSPVQKNATLCIAPELLSVTTIPHALHKNAVYHSLAQLILRSLFKNADDNNIKVSSLFPIVDTSLYWFLVRCLQKVPENRLCLLM